MYHSPDSKVHGANMGPLWGWQDPGGPHVGPMNSAIWVGLDPNDSFIAHQITYVSFTASKILQFEHKKGYAFCDNSLHKNILNHSDFPLSRAQRTKKLRNSLYCLIG